MQWTYNGGSGAVTIIGPAPESKRTEISYWVDQNSNWGYGTNTARAGRIYDERTYNSAGQMLRRKMSDWAMTGSNATGNPSGTLSANRHVRPIREVEFLLDTGGRALAKTTTFTYDTTYEFTVGVERTNQRDYDFVSWIQPRPRRWPSAHSVPSLTAHSSGQYCLLNEQSELQKS